MYLVLSRTPNNALSVRNLGVQLFPGKLDYFLDLYRQATRENYEYLSIDADTFMVYGYSFSNTLSIPIDY